MADAHDTDDTDDLDDMADISARLADAVDRALPGWVRGVVADRLGGRNVEDDALASAVAACRADVRAGLVALFATDIDRQRTTPLAVLRDAARHPSSLLATMGVPPVDRDPFDAAHDPDDVYALAVRTWADLGPEVAELGLMWGAAKAHLHLRRRGSTGR